MQRLLTFVLLMTGLLLEAAAGDLLRCGGKVGDARLLVRDGYMALYSTRTHCPVYVGWKLTRERIGGAVPRCKAFFPDEDVPAAHRVANEDYKGSGWSRGHMCPAADNKDSEVRMQESCLLTNVCPQDQSLNSGAWNSLEMRCRNWVERYGDIFVVCGPVFYAGKRRYIGQSCKIAVPDAFFKVVLRLGSRPEAIGFIFQNTGDGQSMRSACVSVDEVEAITGIDFFPALPDDVEDRVEASSDIGRW